MFEKTAIALVRKYGNVIGRITARQDVDIWDRPSEYHDSNVTVRVIDAGYRVDESFYERNTDGPINDAFDRIMETWYGHSSDNIEEFERYMNIFRPNVPMIIESVQTGYSQGDSVTLAVFIEEGKSEPSKGEKVYQTATRELELCKNELEIIGAISRGQFWQVTYESLEINSVDMLTDTADVDWVDEDSCGGILCLEEFWPWKELRDYADSMIGQDATLEDVVQEL